MKNANDPLISRRNIKWLILAGGLAISAAIYSAKLYLDRRFQAEVSRLTEILQLRPGIAVGEIGAGDGAMTIAIATRAGPNGHVFPTEIDPKLIEKIHRAVEEHKLNTVTALPATASDTGLPENCCDAVFMRGVYHHLTDPADIDRNL